VPDPAQAFQFDLREKAVTDRTDELKQANQTLVEQNKELQAFTYVSSHDLQELLRKIQALADRLLDKETLTEGG